MFNWPREETLFKLATEAILYKWTRETTLFKCAWEGTLLVFIILTAGTSLWLLKEMINQHNTNTFLFQEFYQLSCNKKAVMDKLECIWHIIYNDIWHIIYMYYDTGQVNLLTNNKVITEIENFNANDKVV